MMAELRAVRALLAAAKSLPPEQAEALGRLAPRLADPRQRAAILAMASGATAFHDLPERHQIARDVTDATSALALVLGSAAPLLSQLGD